jgi:hypothetical protein
VRPGIRRSPHDPRWLWSQRDGEEEGTTFQGRPMDDVAIALALLDEQPFEEIRRPDEASTRDWQFRWAMHASKSSKQASALGRRSA